MPDVEQEAERALVEGGAAPNTLRARRQALRYFWAWADVALGLEEAYPVEAEVARRFILEHLQGPPKEVEEELLARRIKRKRGSHCVATVEARMAHLSAEHRRRRLQSPLSYPIVSELLSAGRRVRARTGGQRRKTPITKPELDALVATCAGGSLWDLRDRAMLLFAWSSGGRRRSEVAVARVEDLRREGPNYIFRLGFSKTDQAGKGHEVPVKGAAARALRCWLEVSEITSGAIFRRVHQTDLRIGAGLSPTSLNNIVKRRAELAELDGDFTFHSIRAGFVTEGSRQGHTAPVLMEMTLHRSMDVFMGYYRVGQTLKNPAATLAGS